MIYKIDYLEDVYEWSITSDGAEYERVTDYTPTIYATYDGTGTTENGLDELCGQLEYYPSVAAATIEGWRRGFRHDREDVLRIDVRRLDELLPLAYQIRELGHPGEYKLYNVDLSREFRYCLENDLDPTPDRIPSTIEIDVSQPELANPPIAELTIDDQTVIGSPAGILHAVQSRLDQADPDVLILPSSELIPVLYETADQFDVDLQLGRLPGWQQLAGRSTYESYGTVGHSPSSIQRPRTSTHRPLEYVLLQAVRARWLSRYGSTFAEAAPGDGLGVNRECSHIDPDL